MAVTVPVHVTGCTGTCYCVSEMTLTRERASGGVRQKR